MSRSLLVLPLVLAACGGGSSDPDASPSADAQRPVVDGPSPDGGPADAGAIDAALDAAPVASALFAHIDEQLFRIDTTTGARTLVGVTGVTFFTIVDAFWDPVANQQVLLTDAFGAPVWSTIDLCTGTVTDVGPVTFGGAAREIEGITRADDGTIYVSGDGDASNNFFCETVATLDPVTRDATALGGAVDTLQDDIDQLEWADGVLYGLDVFDAGSSGGIYTIDRTTGAATLATATSSAVRRLAWDVAGGRMLASTNEEPRRLVAVDLATGALTGIGNIHTTAELNGRTMDAIFFAPEPTCP